MRCRDRLAELQSLAGLPAPRAAAAAGDCCVVSVGEGDEEIRKIFDEADRIRRWIHDVSANTQLLRRIYEDATFHNNKNLQDQLDSVVTQSNATGLKICGALREMEPRALRPLNDARARVARLQYATARRLYADALERHQALLQAIRDQEHALLQEQIRITNLTISDEECQNLLETKNISLFVDNVQAQTAEARLALRDVETRHADLLRLEDSLREVRDLFVQAAQLVQQQQEQVDTVEYYATQATGHVERGGHEILKGNVYAQKSRKKKLGLIICLASGFLVVLLVLVAT